MIFKVEDEILASGPERIRQHYITVSYTEDGKTYALSHLAPEFPWYREEIIQYLKDGLIHRRELNNK